MTTTTTASAAADMAVQLLQEQCTRHGCGRHRPSAVLVQQLRHLAAAAATHLDCSTDNDNVDKDARSSGDDDDDAALPPSLLPSAGAVLDAAPSSCALQLRGTYVGARQLLALADVLRVDTTHFHGAPSSTAWLTLLPDTDTATASASAATTATTASMTNARRRSTRYSVGGGHDEAHMLTSPSCFFAGCSMTPLLSTLSLCDLHLSFARDYTTSTTDTAAATVSSSSSSALRCVDDGNAVLRYVLQALEGHPTLRLLDVSDNAVGAALLPALTRLLRRTPTLTRIVLDRTLLTDEEKAVVAALCALNERRCAAFATSRDDATAAATAYARWCREQTLWLSIAQRKRAKQQQQQQQSLRTSTVAAAATRTTVAA